ncbi:hypothetical protein F4802DRAFT_164859 [Xylaria palmicola]|nr:hypothetical protein F4802DRAFT_164859 [Xylaria palmicola]
MEVPRSQRILVIDALLQGYSSLSVTTLLEPLAPNFSHHTLPKSLGIPTRDRDAFSKHAAGIFGIFQEFRMIPETIIEDSAAGVVAIHAKMLGTLEGDEGEWRNECVMIVRLTDDRLKVLEVSEFVDSAKAMELARNHGPNILGGKARGGPKNRHSDWVSMLTNPLVPLGAAAIVIVGVLRMFPSK